MNLTSPLLGVVRHPYAEFDTVYLCAKFNDFSFSSSIDITGGPKI